MPITEISLTQEEGRICQVFTHSHIITADDPADPDAEDEGPTPLELLMSALGSSAAIAMKAAAERLALPVEEIQVNVQWSGHHAALLAPDAPLPAGPIRREIRIRVARDITEAERDQLLAAAKASPVDRVMAGGRVVKDALYVLGYAEPDIDADPAD